MKPETSTPTDEGGDAAKEIGVNLRPGCVVCGVPATVSYTPLRFNTVYCCTDHQIEVEDVMTAMLGNREYRVRRLPS